MSKRYNILIVDDISENIDLLVGVLEHEYELRAVTNGEAAIKIANSTNPPDLILLDVMMPDMNGYAVCKTLKYYENTKHIPIIFVTAKNETFDEERGFKLGGADYITKPIDPPLVLARVKTHLTISDVNRRLAYEVEKLTNELDTLYTTDKLTGFKNIKGLQQDIEGDSNKSLLLLDIARMHEINEHYGYYAGDYILKQFAQEITDAFSKLDVALYRTHGDQFAILSHGDLYEEFQECVNQFIEELDLKLFPVKEDDSSLSVSIQVYAGFVKNAKEDILMKVSMALHEAKKENRSLVVHAFDGHLKNKKNIEIVSNLYDAIKEQRIEVFFQPIIDNITQKISKYETLVRSIESDGTVVLPYIFLEAAKRARLYPFLTREVIDQAFKEFQDRDEEVSINISWDDITNPLTRKFILEHLDEEPPKNNSTHLKA
ncbi:MAG: response regulator [Campylobacterota bacterium]|nr:response regulator [Campylobacterota bacterium]